MKKILFVTILIFNFPNNIYAKNNDTDMWEDGIRQAQQKINIKSQEERIQQQTQQQAQQQQEYLQRQQQIQQQQQQIIIQQQQKIIQQQRQRLQQQQDNQWLYYAQPSMQTDCSPSYNGGYTCSSY